MSKRCARCKVTFSGPKATCPRCLEYSSRWSSENRRKTNRIEIVENTPEGTKWCTKCEEYLPLDRFYEWDKRGISQCRQCKCEYVKRHHQKTKDSRLCFHCRAPLEEGDKRLCEGCKTKARERYHANGDEHRAAGRRRKRQLKELVLEAYGGARCVCCGETAFEFLTMDHANNDGNEHRRELKEKHGYNMDMYRWLKNNNFPRGFQVLCWNCNCAKAHYGICPHEVERRDVATELRVVR